MLIIINLVCKSDIKEVHGVDIFILLFLCDGNTPNKVYADKQIKRSCDLTNAILPVDLKVHTHLLSAGMLLK